MNQELANIIKIYATESHNKLIDYLIGKSKDTLIGILVDLLTMYINDKNSSTIREFITVTMAGYNHREKKIGYNGFKQDSFIPGATINCEAKPKNIDTVEFEKFERGERKTKPMKLNGGGNFSDYSQNRLQKDMLEKNLNMLVSGFVDGKLIYILEFPFSCPTFINNLKNEVENWQAKMQGSQSTKGQFLRSASFNYKNYIDCQKLKTVYILNKEELFRYKPYIDGGFYQFLEGKAK